MTALRLTSSGGGGGAGEAAEVRGRRWWRRGGGGGGGVPRAQVTAADPDLHSSAGWFGKNAMNDKDK